MKKLACMAALLSILLCGCALSTQYREAAASSQTGADRNRSVQSSAAASQPAASQSAASGSGETGESAEISATQTQGAAPASPTEQAVLYAYDRAVESYGWFSMDTLPSTGSMVEENGCQYQRVDYEGISSLEELRTYLGDLFAQPIIDQLLPAGTSAPLYRDIGDRLYVQPAARGADIHKGAVTVSARQESATAWSVNVTVEILGDDLTTVTGVEMDSFPYELTDGRWVFTNFYLVN